MSRLWSYIKSFNSVGSDDSNQPNYVTSTLNADETKRGLDQTPVADFGLDVSRGVHSGYSIIEKFGRNPDTDIGTAPEDIWPAGGLYTGFNATANENIEVFSDDVNDVGSVVSSGTVSETGTSTAITDSSATFVTDGVAVGDVVINDTQAFHGYVESLTETQITVGRWYNDLLTTHIPASGDSYRVATSVTTGAAVLRLSRPLNADYEEQANKYVVLNGTTGVTVTGDFFRLSEGYVCLAGSSNVNEGNITVRQATTTANVFIYILANYGQVTQCVDTVPAGKSAIIKHVVAGITRANGSPGSATVVLFTRRPGCAWNARKPYELQTGARIDEYPIGGLNLIPGTDIKFQILSVSDNNTVADATLEYYLVDS